MRPATDRAVHQMQAVGAAVGSYASCWTWRAELVGGKAKWMHSPQQYFHVFIILL